MEFSPDGFRAEGRTVLSKVQYPRVKASQGLKTPCLDNVRRGFSWHDDSFETQRFERHVWTMFVEVIKRSEVCLGVDGVKTPKTERSGHDVFGGMLILKGEPARQLVDNCNQTKLDCVSLSLAFSLFLPPSLSLSESLSLALSFSLPLALSLSLLSLYLISVCVCVCASVYPCRILTYRKIV